MASKKPRASSPRKDSVAPISINGRTGITAVFGDPVEHSMSPAMHNAAYAALGMDRVYVAFHVTSENFRAAIQSIIALGILGVNLTVPHKEAAARMFQRGLTAEAKLVQAVNCIVNDDGMCRGDNTDARGLERDLRDLGVDLTSRSVIVIGAGGAAASAIVACGRMGASSIVVANRTASRAANLTRRYGRFQSSSIAFAPRSLEWLTHGSILADAALVLNATSMGLTTIDFAPIDYAATPRNCFFYDLIYRPEPTPFLHGAIACGRPHADGAGMLINQGELAFELFNQVAPPPGVMRGVLMERLGRA